MPTGTSAPTYLIAADHAGFTLKEWLKTHVSGVNWIDLGTTDCARVDYPDYADRVARGISEKGGRGILICGSGQGMAMRANRYPGIRAALVWNEDSCRLSRQHNDANILCLGARLISPELAKNLFEIFNATAFEGGRHQSRVEKTDKPVSCLPKT